MVSVIQSIIIIWGLLKSAQMILDLILGGKKLRLENEMLKAKLGEAESTINIYKAGYWNLFSAQRRNISKDEIDAVKYAMKHSHPDNGGDAADFIRFQKVYKELTGK